MDSYSEQARRWSRAGWVRQKNDALRFTVKADSSVQFYESFTIEVQDLVRNQATIYLNWENTSVHFLVVSNADQRVEYLTSTNGHHEYRAKPLPAYAVTFRQPAHATVYVAAQLGTVQSVRTDPWRIFDMLWMLHTMDYEGRDDFNNGLLRTFSVLGLLTVTSGFTLYFVSSSWFRRKPKRGQRSMITQI